jgi:hypothetical protein
MMPTPVDYWVLACVLADQTLNGELDLMSDAWRPVTERIAGVAPEHRTEAFRDVAQTHGAAAAGIVQSVADADPLGPPPNPAATRCYATLKDIALIVANQLWLWTGWIALGVLNVLASDPGIGKTRFALDVARRLYFGLPWPGNQTNTLPAGSLTLWIQGDRNFAEMLQCARDFGLPDDAVVLGSSPDEPMGSLNLDDAATLAAIETRIVAAGVSLVVIDTVGMTTDRDLTRPEEARKFFAPIIELAGRTGVPILALTHLSKDKEALGRRIVEKARVVMMMTQPDPEGQPDRRRLWVSKTAVQKPPALGITMKGDGNDYDFEPPKEPDATPRKRGPTPAKLEECQRWLTERLTTPAPVCEVRRDADAAKFAVGTLYAARDALNVDEYQVGRLKWWKLPLAPEAKLGPVGDVRVIPNENSDNSDKPF